MGTIARPPRIISNTTVAIATASAESSPAPRGVGSFRILATQAFYVKVGPPGTAITINDSYCVANREQYFLISEGQVVVVVRVSVDATGFIAWCT